MFSYHLPKEKIADRPTWKGGRREDSRLLHARVKAGQLNIEDKRFLDLSNTLKSGDVLVLNDSRVRKSRIFCKKETGASIEVLLIALSGDGEWRALIKPLKRVKAGEELFTNSGRMLKVVDKDEIEGVAWVVFPEGNMAEFMEEEGAIPIPPYIRKGYSDSEDEVDYQNVFSRSSGSIAAPTAGLHFSEELLECLRQQGVIICYLTLHVGEGSIRFTDKVYSEQFLVPDNSHQEIVKAKKEGRRVVVVGTTVVRALESFYNNEEQVTDTLISTDLFISPGYEFKTVNTLITNFHQSGSTHLSLVSAFLGEENIKQIYNHGLENNYQFLSYGDGMLLEST